MDLAALRTAVRLRANCPPDDGVWTDSFVDDAVNEALADISQRFMWPWLEYVEDVTVVTVPLTFADLTYEPRALRMVSLSGELLNFVPGIDIDQYTEVMGERGWVFSVTGSTIDVRPELSVGDVARVRYFRNEPELSADSDLPLMPTAGDRAVIRQACAFGFSALDDQSSAAMNQGAADRAVEVLEKSHLLAVIGPRSPRLRPGAAY